MPAPASSSEQRAPPDVMGAPASLPDGMGGPVRPLRERLRDYTIFSGTAGGVFGACKGAQRNLPAVAIIGQAAWVGGHWAAATGGFIGIRELLLQGRWEEDREGVSGIAAAAVGSGMALVHSGPRMAGRAGVGCFVFGCAAHYLHRWWLRARYDYATYEE